jgi:hypothetical protein
MNAAAMLIATVGAVGVLHTLVPDHWLPIALLARQRGWNARQTASAALTAGLGHTISTLLLGALVWGVGALAAQRFGYAVSYVSSAALIVFGAWIAIGAAREQQHGHRHVHQHADGMVHAHYHLHDNGESHDHEHTVSGRTSLLLILGSSPMIEGIPAFFAAGRYGTATLSVMAIVFAAATILTYVCVTVSSFAALDRLSLGPVEKYGEVLSGALVMLVGVAFAVWPLE